jgi:hypothetical protein
MYFPRLHSVILFLTGAQLALGSCDFSKDKGERLIILATSPSAGQRLRSASTYLVLSERAVIRRKPASFN